MLQDCFSDREYALVTTARMGRLFARQASDPPAVAPRARLPAASDTKGDMSTETSAPRLRPHFTPEPGRWIKAFWRIPTLIAGHSPQTPSQFVANSVGATRRSPAVRSAPGELRPAPTLRVSFLLRFSRYSGHAFAATRKPRRPAMAQLSTIAFIHMSVLFLVWFVTSAPASLFGSCR